MMRVRHILVAATVLVLGGSPATAHHVAEVAADLYKRDMFFQPMDQAAPEFTLVTADGKPVRLSDFRGKVVALDFIYARCKNVCPVQSELLASIQTEMNRTPMKGLVAFVSVATDTEDAKQTAAIMRGYGAKHGFDPANWVLLYRGTGPPDIGIKTAAQYGLRFEIANDGDQVHGIVTHIIDQNGRLRARFHGLKFDPTDLILFVNALTNEPPGAASAMGVAAAAAGAGAPLWFEGLLTVVGLAIAAPAVLLIQRLGRR